MKKILLAISIVLTIVSCTTDYNMNNTGLANGKFDGTMYDYFHSDSYNWDSLIIMIDRAGLQDLFNGEVEGYEEITFGDRRIIPFVGGCWKGERVFRDV